MLVCVCDQYIDEHCLLLVGLALRAATKAVEGGHPVIMSACWYLDYNQDWSAFLATDISTTATIAVAAHTNGYAYIHPPTHLPTVSNVVTCSLYLLAQDPAAIQRRQLFGEDGVTGR